jgi:hypothetical protein
VVGWSGRGWWRSRGAASGARSVSIEMVSGWPEVGKSLPKCAPELLGPNRLNRETPKDPRASEQHWHHPTRVDADHAVIIDFDANAVELPSGPPSSALSLADETV